MPLSATNELSQKISLMPDELARVIGTRIGLRALPLVTFGQDWTIPQQFALLANFRQLQLCWSSLAYDASIEDGWSAQRQKMLEQMWRKGVPANDIARSLGNVSKNAVIGRAYRSGLSLPTAHVLSTHADVFEGDVQRQAAAALYNSLEVVDSSASASRALEILVSSIEHMSRFMRSYSPELIYEQVERDIYSIRSDDPILVAQSPLWRPNSPPLALSLPRQGGWSVWRRWYDARVAGRPTERLPYELSMRLDLEILSLPEEVWNAHPQYVNSEISQIVRYIKPRMARDDFGDAELNPNKLGQVEPQSTTAIRFTSDSDIIDVNFTAGQDDIQTDADAGDRFQEVLDSANDLIELYQRFGLGGNQVVTLIQQTKRLVEALGASPSEIRPGLLIPRGERLRQKLFAQDLQDELGAEPPIPPQFLTNLKVLVSAYNVFVALDPLLSAHDEARLPPELRDKLISPQAGSALVASAVHDHIATSSVQEVLTEEAENAPHIPDTGRRESRRYSESIRNLARVAIERAFTPIKMAWNKRDTIGNVAKGVGKFGSWVAKHSDKLASLFPEDSTTRQIISFITKTFRDWS